MKLSDRLLQEIGLPPHPHPPSRGERLQVLCGKLEDSINTILQGVPEIPMNFGVGSGPVVDDVDPDFGASARQGDSISLVWDKVAILDEQLIALQRIEASARDGKITARTAPDDEWEIFWTIPVDQLLRFKTS